MYLCRILRILGSKLRRNGKGKEERGRAEEWEVEGGEGKSGGSGDGLRSAEEWEREGGEENAASSALRGRSIYFMKSIERSVNSPREVGDFSEMKAYIFSIPSPSIVEEMKLPRQTPARICN
ncbi:hypothetical protein FCM35_KLT21009 [Carex littledalei]|uniref:Uncharacterized protein n=1 Tax=Carex littledalei TaxID=544730 RepID=A0A833QWR6_9POAL|nr:hypothetical protein FCM35_KLT21009 [Carex littledalei]